MTLPDRICYSLLLFAVCTGLLSCEDPSEVGLSLNADGTGIGVFVDEIILTADNVFIDSLRTDGDPRLLVGKYNDPIFGNSISKAVTQFGPASFTYIDRDAARVADGKFLDDYVLDSVILQLRLNYYHSDNIGQPQTIKVVQIADTLFTGVNYYAHFPVPVEDNSTVYGESTFSVNPSIPADSVVKIELPLFGEQTIDFMRQDKAGSLSSDSIRNIIKGIALIPGDNNSAILGFDPRHDTTSLSVYYHIQHIEKDTLVEDSLSIVYNFSTSKRFNSISTDRGSSLLVNPENNLDPFAINDENAYLQSGTGVYPRLDLAPFRQFLADQGKIIINRTDIEIPVSTTSTNTPYISGVEDVRFFFIEDGSNIKNSSSTRILTNLSYLSSSAVTLSAVLDDDQTTFEAETTLFTQLINTDVLDVDKLLLVPTDITGFNRSIFDKSGIKMRIYYTVPK